MPGRFILAVIPARYQSTRLPGKPLSKIGGKTMLEHVWTRVGRSRLVSRVAIATDDERIYNTARGFGAEAFMTDPRHPTGTDRIAEVAALAAFRDAEFVVNVQGDEPFIDPSAIDQAIQPCLDASDVVMSTLKTRFADPDEASSPNIVKVVTDRAGNALYFSRLPIPFAREGAEGITWYKHLGLYVFERSFLLGYPRLTRGPLEAAEKLEQLRALENGYAIRVVETANDSLGVDTEEDLTSARARTE